MGEGERDTLERETLKGYPERQVGEVGRSNTKEVKRGYFFISQTFYFLPIYLLIILPTRNNIYIKTK